MKKAFKYIFESAGISAGLLLLAVCSVEQQSARPDLSRTPTLYAVAYAHLDTQWRWPYPTTISKYLPKTMRTNFALFRKYPRYIFNFSGANRYRMMKEYFPLEYEMVKKYVAAGRWFPCGSSMEECDVNIPSAESVIRQILYGSRYFRSEFGRNSSEFMLPDSFGFPASLPSILAHCGIKGFSTQRTPVGIPFNVGFWEGLDKTGVIAALNPGRYTSGIRYDLSRSPDHADIDTLSGSGEVDWPQRIQGNGNVSGLFTDYMYYGTGDRGGAPDEASVRLLNAIVCKNITKLPLPPKRHGANRPASLETVQVGGGQLRVESATAEQMFLDIDPHQVSRLPRFKGEMQLTSLSPGSLTSQSYVKRWNRHNEVLADAAEKASVVAEWLGGRAYPRQRLNDAWSLVLGSQFHDILAGTSIPKAYEYTWNDLVLAMNQFALVLTSSVELVAGAMDSMTQGIPILVSNALEYEREDVVEASVQFSGANRRSVRVFAPDGSEVPAQLAADRKILFLAKVPALGYVVYDVRFSDNPSTDQPSELKVTRHTLENARYRVQLNDEGDVAGIYDKLISRELLSASAHLEIKTDNPVRWPAWSMDWLDQKRAPRSRVKGPAIIRIKERGPVRVAIEIDRQCEGSRFLQVVRLASGDAGNRLEFANVIDWKTQGAHLKAVFPLCATNPLATYNLGVGTIQRNGNDATQFEVGSHQWFDLTDAGGSFGVSVLSDCKYASDKPDQGTLRLTLLRTPGTRGGFPDQGTQDLGRHEFIYGLAAHRGDWRSGRTDCQAYRLNQPLLAFQSGKHAGILGGSFSFLHLNDERVRLLALKKAEQSDETIIRLVETEGSRVPNLRVRFASAVINAREVDGQEMPLGKALVQNGELLADFKPYQIRTFALKLAAAHAKAMVMQGQTLPLAYDLSVASGDGQVAKGGFGAEGGMLPAELLPARIAYKGVDFALGVSRNGQANAVTCRGQTLMLPTGNFKKLFFLAAADHDQKAIFRIGDQAQKLQIQYWSGFIGQWDNRLWQNKEGRIAADETEVPPAVDSAGTRSGKTEPLWIQRPAKIFSGLASGFVKGSTVAWFASHCHNAAGANVPYSYSYLFAYEIKVPSRAKTLTLPNNDKIRIFAITIVDQDLSLRPVQSLIDMPPSAKPSSLGSGN